jgi:hypothetical protein
MGRRGGAELLIEGREDLLVQCGKRVQLFWCQVIEKETAHGRHVVRGFGP